MHPSALLKKPELSGFLFFVVVSLLFEAEEGVPVTRELSFILELERLESTRWSSRNWSWARMPFWKPARGCNAHCVPSRTRRLRRVLAVTGLTRAACVFADHRGPALSPFAEGGVSRRCLQKAPFSRSLEGCALLAEYEE